MELSNEKKKDKEEGETGRKRHMTGYLEGLVVVILATALTIWINDNFDIGGDYVEMKPEA